MPSGSHGGGGGGGHFGGGFSGGSHFGGSGGSSFGGSYYNGPRRPGRAPIIFHYFYWGGHRYAIGNDDRTKIGSMIGACAVVLIMMLFMIFAIVSSFGAITKIKKDYQYYQDMIIYAEENTEYLITGKVQSKFFNEDAGKWYVTYYFFTAESIKVNGYTYSIYDDNEIKNFKSGDDISLAVDSIPLTEDTDSINLDYKNMPLTKDGEYINAIKGAVIPIIIEVVLASILTYLIITTIKNYKKLAEKVDDNTDSVKYKYICTYCGGKLTEEDKSCPHCGSSTIETKVES